jgi:KUP system potassium uptake protein
MNSNVDWAPLALINNLKHNKVLHEQNVILTVITEESPHVSLEERLQFEHLKNGFYRIIIHYGFMEDPNVPEVLESLNEPGLVLKPDTLIFFLARERLFAIEGPGMAVWRERLFVWMSRNALGATFFYGIPPSRVVELGQQIEL